jgi:regulator of CtrA degradation
LRRGERRYYPNIGMSQPATINLRIIEALYSEALVLSDEVRAAFMLSGRIASADKEEDLVRLALSCEALRTTTRMMHAVAWLLNHRAYFLGELSEFQLRRHGRLTRDAASGDPERLALLDPEIRELIGATERFYARLMRLDNGWRQDEPRAPSAIASLRERLGVAIR